MSTTNMFDYKYLTKEHLKGFDNYKYMAIDTSPLSVYVMHPFWNKVVDFIPRWVAPNVLTFAGFLLTVANFLLLSYYDYDYTASTLLHLNATEAPLNGHRGAIPDQLWLLMAAALFLAYTLDGVDGKQARKTGTSGPLGEMFDHGLDSYSVFFIPACLYSIFGRADYSATPLRMYYVIWNILLNFYLSHWEKYNTGVLFLPWGYDVSMWASTLVFLWTGIQGTGFYKRNIIGSINMAHVFEFMIYVAGVGTNLPVSIYNVYRSYKDGTGKMRTPLEAMRPLWPLLTMFLLITYWVHRSPRDICNADPRALYLLVGTLFSNVACRLIVSQMSGQRCEAINPLFYPAAFACAASLYAPRLELTCLYTLTAVAVAAHAHYAASVVRQMCAHFRINCFVIKKRTD